MKNTFSALLKLLYNYRLTTDFQNVDQYTGGKWLIHDTKQHKENQLHRQSKTMIKGLITVGRELRQ